MVVNDRPVLACQTFCDEIADKEGNIDVDNMSINQLVAFIKENPSVLKRPIIVDDRRVQVGYNEEEIRRIALKAFDIAMKRRKKVTSVDKAIVLDSSRLWRKVVEDVAKAYPEVTLEHMLVDNCAMQLVNNPSQFDVILTENMFGDILSDEASMITGSIGMLSSASLNDTKFGLYEPSHGSAPDIAGKGIANPLATILSAAMMLRYSLDLDREADAIEGAVKRALEEGYRTVDIAGKGEKTSGTTEIGDIIAGFVRG